MFERKKMIRLVCVRGRLALWMALLLLLSACGGTQTSKAETATEEASVTENAEVEEKPAKENAATNVGGEDSNRAEIIDPEEPRTDGGTAEPEEAADRKDEKEPELFDETTWFISFSASTGGQYFATFHEDGTYSAVQIFRPNLPHSGTWRMEGDKLYVDEIEYAPDREGYSSVERFDVMGSSDWQYRIEPFSIEEYEQMQAELEASRNSDSEETDDGDAQPELEAESQERFRNWVFHSILYEYAYEFEDYSSKTAYEIQPKEDGAFTVRIWDLDHGSVVNTFEQRYELDAGRRILSQINRQVHPDDPEESQEWSMEYTYTPEDETFVAFLQDWDSGFEWCRRIVLHDAPLSTEEMLVEYMIYRSWAREQLHLP